MRLCKDGQKKDICFAIYEQFYIKQKEKRMKIRNYLLLGLFLCYGIQSAYAQCGVSAGDDKTITCGNDVQLDALAIWSKTTDSTADLGGFRSVYFLNADTGYTVAGNGQIHRTWDGGKIWTTHNVSNDEFRSVFFTDADTGFVVGKDANGKGVIAKTIDGGTTWSTQTIENTYGLTSVFFTSKNVGFAVGPVVTILKTTDGGNTWIRKNVSATDHFVSVKFPTPAIGYAIGEIGNVSKTMDGGETWLNDTKLSGNKIIFSASFPDANTGFLAGTHGILQKTVDGGNSWNAITVAGNDDTIKAVFFVSPLIGYVGSRNSIWKTTDGGINWKEQNVNANVNDLFFSSEKVGYATGTRTLKLIEPETITWSPSEGLSSTSVANPYASPNKTITYKVTFTTLNGCSASDSVTVFVNPFLVTTTKNVSLICGGSVKFPPVITNYKDNNLLSYSWLPITDLDVDTIESPTATVTKNTHYYLTVTTPNGCIAKDSTEVQVKPLTANAGANKMHVCGDSVQLDNVFSNYTGTAPLTYSWLPVTGLNNPTIFNPITKAAGLTYTVTITTQNGCTASDIVQVNLIKMNGIEICMVGADSTNKNVVTWNQPVSDAIDSVFIYRETSVTGNYIKIGSVENSRHAYKDMSSAPEVKSNKYKISILDSCGEESAQSPYHKTMHLSINKGIGTSWNLIWEAYEGFTVPTYDIYRGTNAQDLQFLDATSGGSTQYTNYNPPPGDLYYQVEVANPNNCDFSGLTGPLRSNVAKNDPVGINEEKGDSFTMSIYPNPASESITLMTDKLVNRTGYITIYNMLGEAVKRINIEQTRQQILISELANGFYTLELKSGNNTARQKLSVKK